MGDIHAEGRGPLQHLARRRGAGRHHLQGVVRPELLFGRRRGKHGQDDRRSAEMGDAVVPDGIEDDLGGNDPVADEGSPHDGHGPDMPPAVAVEQRHGVQVDRVFRNPPGRHRAHGHQVGTAMVIHDALRPPARARGVVQGQRIPFRFRVSPSAVAVAHAEEVVVGELSEPVPAALGGGELLIHDVHHLRGRFHGSQGLPHHRGIGRIGDQHPAVAVFQDVGDGVRIEAHVDRVKHAAGHRYPVMGLQQFRRVPRDHRHRVAPGDAEGIQSGSQPLRPGGHLLPGIPPVAVDDRVVIWVRVAGPRKDGDRAQNHMVQAGNGGQGVVVLLHIRLPAVSGKMDNRRL